MREPTRAAEVVVEIGHVDAGHAHLRAGEQHLVGDRAAEVDAHLREPIAFFRPLLAGAGLEIPA